MAELRVARRAVRAALLLGAAAAVAVSAQDQLLRGWRARAGGAWIPCCAVQAVL